MGANKGWWGWGGGTRGPGKTVGVGYGKMEDAIMATNKESNCLKQKKSFFTNLSLFWVRKFSLKIQMSRLDCFFFHQNEFLVKKHFDELIDAKFGDLL